MNGHRLPARRHRLRVERDRVGLTTELVFLFLAIVGCVKGSAVPRRSDLDMAGFAGIADSDRGHDRRAESCGVSW